MEKKQALEDAKASDKRREKGKELSEYDGILLALKIILYKKVG